MAHIVRDDVLTYVSSCIENEGFSYCFDSYSRFEEVKDETFHELREKYLEYKDLLEAYIYKKTKEEEKMGIGIWSDDEVNKNFKPKTTLEKLYKIPQSLAEFIDVPVGSEHRFPRIIYMIWSAMKEKGLLEGYAIRVNDEVSKIFNVDKDANNYISDSNDPNGFNFYNLGKKVSKIFAKNKNL